MLEKRSYRESIGKKSWRIGVWMLLAILVAAVMRPAAKVYLVQEALAVLLLAAVSSGTILVLGVAFVLIQEGIRRTVQWMKLGYIWLAHLGPQEQ
jgi:uncharacterized membrane protein